MEPHINQANHNLQLHAILCERYSTQYFDWKITILFYVALHLLKALAKRKNIKIGQTHSDIESNCNPRRFKGKMPLTERAWIRVLSCSEI
ncbi:hypothetical protein [Chitinophaga sp. YIM B06452]|uniref:hypothetical protein n=1 Tax=Chitinophaga sp. YIM B06452 TaxID=3082158 RepID=UPI0031FF226C